VIEPVTDRRAPITPQLALRVAILGVLAFILFAIVFFRLWYLQVLSGDQYRHEANNNRVRLIREQAPRGAIVDRNGFPIVENRQATVVQVDPDKLPVAERVAAARWGQEAGLRLKRHKGHRGPAIPIPPVPYVATAKPSDQLSARFDRLAHVLSISPATIQREVIQQLAILPYAAVTLRTDVPATMRDFILERSEDFQGVSVPNVYLRRYPYHQLGAQFVGTVGEISPQELKLPPFRGVSQGTIVGQEGIEASYDRFLRGVDGANRIIVDSLGQPKGTAQARPPVPGHQLRLSIDLGLQKEGQLAIAKGIALARQNGNAGTAGAFVALDPRNGEVLALGSYPSFDPSVLAHPISQTRYDKLFGNAAGAPRLDRAIAGLYPTGSTFKPITALAALSSGVIGLGSVVNDSGCVSIGAAGQQFCNAGKFANGAVNVVRALQVSSDVFFYTMGAQLNPITGEPLQHWARKLGLGHRTGIDLPGEFPGNVPDRRWRARIAKKEARYEQVHHVPCCTFSDKRPWTVGDNVNLAVGQGDLQATPLQMATAYSAIVTGGRVPRPHLGLDVEDSSGRLLQKLDPGSARHVVINPTFRQAVLDGLHAAASQPGGTSADVFRGWNQGQFPVYGKTGTAQRPPHGDQSWYVCYSYDGSPGHRPIVLAITIENGGFGAEAAAPAARLMLSRWFGIKGKVVVGKSHTR